MYFLIVFFIFFIIIIIILILISIVFITLYERHLLGLRQNRLGPSKRSMGGLLQAVLDGLKLFKKEYYFPYLSDPFFYFCIPVFLFFLIFIE